MTKENKKDQSLSYRMAGWYGTVFSVCFLLYGGVKIVLGILDRNYSDMANPIFALIVGLILISFVVAYFDMKKWGWYGLIGMNGFVVLFGIILYSHYLDILLLIFSIAALYLLFVPKTKQYFLKS